MKSIAIVGGGISGLACLHYLNQRFGKRVKVTLYERHPQVGGNIHTLREDGFLFEFGPNGFLANQPNTLSFINDLGLTGQLIEANASSAKRYVQVKGRLHRFPLDPWSFLNFQPFTYLDSLRLLAEVFQPKRDNSQESVAQFVNRRCGNKTTEFLIDPMVSGIFAGDVQQLHMASVFPRMVALENTHGSMIKAMVASKKTGKMKPRLLSFQQGMEQVIKALGERYAQHITCGVSISSIDELKADHIILSCPAYVTSRLVAQRFPELAKSLDQIVYAPVAVAGFGFAPGAFKRKPKGFGYLIPSNQHKEVLGVLIESNVYLNRAPENQWMLRVMLGGRRNPQITNDSPEDILSKGLREIDKSYGLRENPIAQWVKNWPKAIPQYEMNYPFLRADIADQLKNMPQVSLAGNYLGGISFNETIHAAKGLVDSLNLGFDSV